MKRTYLKLALGIFLIILVVGGGVLSMETIQLKERIKQEEEKSENLENLITYNWETYRNDEFGFRFKYPDYAYVCSIPERMPGLEDAELFLGIYRGESCEDGEKVIEAPTARIIIKQNENNYKTAEEAFWGEFQGHLGIDKSLNSHLGYFKINKFEAYGGEVVGKTSGTWVTTSNNYGAVILRNDYIIKISDLYYKRVVDGKLLGDKPLMDTIISSFYFETLYHWK